MKVIEFHPDGDAVADARAERCALDFLLSDVSQNIRVSTDNFITAVRVLVCEGKFPHDQVEFRYEDHRMIPDRHGRLSNWPNGFCDYNDGWLDRLLSNPHWRS